MRRVVFLGLLFAPATACADSSSGDATPATPEEVRAHDSVIGSSALPGAQGVRKALEVADSAESRARRIAGELPDH